MGLKLNFNLSDLKKIVKKHLLLDDYKIVDIVMAVIVANLFPTDPLWLLSDTCNRDSLRVRWRNHKNPEFSYTIMKS